MFEHMIESIEDEVAKFVMKAEIENNLEREEVVQGQTTAHQPQEGDDNKKQRKHRFAKWLISDEMPHATAEAGKI